MLLCAQKLTRRGSVAASIGPNGVVMGGEGTSKSRRSSVTYPNPSSPERSQAIFMQASCLEYALLVRGGTLAAARC